VGNIMENFMSIILEIENDLDTAQLIERISMIKGINNVSVVDNWSDWDETNYLCSIPGMKEKIMNGMKTPSTECIPIEEVWADV
jgi:hypothetical protein